MSETGLVTSRHRRHVIVEADSGEPVSCIVRGRQLKPLVGDVVSLSRLDDGTAVVEHIETRSTLLTRIDSRGRPEGVAANVTQLAVVVAPRPAPDWTLVDRYFAAAELENVGCLLVWNKCDLEPVDANDRPALYRQIGYPVIEASAKAAHGLDALLARLRDHRSVLVGQSGVGKSSLINAFLGADTLATGGLSEKRALGRHTTTAAALYRLPDGGELIDSPGVRQFAPYLRELERLDWAYREFRPYLGHCRFDDCRHDAEPDCRVKQAIADGTIDVRRHSSYLAFLAVLLDVASR